MQLKLAVVLSFALLSVASAQLIPSNVTGTNVTSLLSGVVVCQTTSQVALMNYMLSIDFVVDAFYRELLGNFSVFANSSSAATSSLPVNARNLTLVNQRFTTIQNQHLTVISTLNNSITTTCNQLARLDVDDAADCFVYSPCTYNFSSILRPDNLLGIINQAIKFEEMLIDSLLGVLSEFAGNVVFQDNMVEWTINHGRHSTALRDLLGENGAQLFPDNTQAGRHATRCSVYSMVVDPRCCQGFEHVQC